MPHSKVVVPRKSQECPRWLYEVLRGLQLATAESQQAVNAVTRGEVPDGSGNPLPNSILPNSPGAVLFVSPGPVFGVDGSNFYWDDTNNLLGLRTASPTAILTVAQPTVTSGVVEQFGIGVIGSFGTPTGGTVQAVLADNDDGTYTAFASGTFAGSYSLDFTPTALPTNRTAVSLDFRIKRVAGAGGALDITFDFSFTSGSLSKTLTGFDSYSTADFTAVTIPITEAELTGKGNLDIITMSGSANNRHGAQISRLAWTATVPTAAAMTHWYSGTTLISSVDYLGRVGIGTGTDLLTRMLTVESDAVDKVPVAIQGFAAQTAVLTQWIDSGNTQLASITRDGYLTTRQVHLNGTSSGTLVFVPAATTTSHTLTWPSAQGAASTLLSNNGSGALSWVSVSSLTADFADNAFTIHDQTNTTAKIAFELAGITVGQTRTLTPQDASYTLAGTNIAQTFTKAQTFVADSDTIGVNISGLNITSQAILNVSDSGGIDVFQVFFDGTTNFTQMVLHAGSIGLGASVAFDPTSLSAARGYLMPDVGSVASPVPLVVRSGTIATNRIPYWSGSTISSTLLSEAAFTYNPSTNTLTVDNISAHSVLGTLTIADAINIVLNTGTGTKIGTATNQKLGFYNATPVIQQTDGAALVNNVTSGGTTDQIDNFTDLTVYANDAATIRNDIYQLARKVKIIGDALRAYGLLS